jgi:hypothetical protein
MKILDAGELLVEVDAPGKDADEIYGDMRETVELQ